MYSFDCPVYHDLGGISVKIIVDQNRIMRNLRLINPNTIIINYVYKWPFWIPYICIMYRNIFIDSS